MSALITLSHLSWSTPDGHRLFSDLNLSFGSERTGLVGRNGVGKTTLLRILSGEIAPTAGTVSVDGRVGFLRQTVKPAAGETLADLFGVREALAILRRAECGAATVDELSNADWTLETRMADALARMHLTATPDTVLTALSGGQRTRAGLAALVFGEPEILVLDEPTNNLDRDGRRAVMDLLAGWTRGAIVVSHDRDLLDGMDAIVEMTSLGAARYGGNWSAYRARKALELDAARHDLTEAQKALQEIDRKAQAAVERQARRDKTGRKKGARNDMPAVVLGGLIENAENTKAGNTRLAARRRTQATQAVTAARARIEILQPLSVAIPATNLAAGKTVLALDQVTAGYGVAPAIIRDLSLTMVGPDRVAVTGPNGSGKTTLLALITGALKPRQGTVRLMTRFALLDQQVSLLDPALSIREAFRALNPTADENACRAALARFMFRADAALQIVGTLSGGQTLRAGLACVLGVSPPPLLILDEPTNHLDIDSVETIETGLRAYDGALLVVSHDEAFLENIGITRRLELPVELPEGR